MLATTQLPLTVFLVTEWPVKVAAKSCRFVAANIRSLQNALENSPEEIRYENIQRVMTS
jgi:hypothetical protein